MVEVLQVFPGDGDENPWQSAGTIFSSLLPSHFQEYRSVPDEKGDLVHLEARPFLSKKRFGCSGSDFHLGANQFPDE